MSNYSRLRKAIFLAGLLLPGLGSTAQQTYFAYLQTENRQPFYVKLNNQRFSSTASGYVILSNLPGGKHDLLIGFPKNEWGEQSVSLDLNQKDQGYLMKQFGDKGWGLFNLQSFAVVMATGKDHPAGKTNNPAEAGEFAGMLSDVVKDPGIAKPEDTRPVKKTPEEKPADKPVAKADTIPAEPEPEKGQKSKSSTARQPESPLIVKKSQSSTGQGLQLEYLDRTGAREDTIRILIEDAQYGGGAEPNTIPGTSIEQVRKDNNKEQIKTPEAGVKPEKGGTLPAKVGEQAIGAALGSSCSSLASESVFMKLRKRLAGESEKERMLSLAKKAFKDNCYTTEQVRNLSGLFLSDEARYAFFDLAYPFVVDPKQFPALQAQLSDPYYQSRFRALLRQ